MPKRADASLELDATDRKILSIMQEDNRTPQRAIGETVNLSAPAVQRRIARLEATGIIQSNISVVEPELAGNFITIIVTLVLESDRMEDKRRIEAALRKEPVVQQCYNVTGETDYILIVIVPTMRDYFEFTRKSLLHLPYLKHFRSHVVFDRVKVGLTVPLL